MKFQTLVAFYLVAIGAVLYWMPKPVPARHPAQLVVRLVIPNVGVGSGVPVKVQGNRTAILTCKHVTAEGNALVARLGEAEWPVVQVQEHPSLDLAVVWIEGQLPVLEISLTSDQIGDRLQAVGWLFGDQLHVCEGLVCGKGKLSVDMMPGCSGGPVLRGQEVVGIVEATVSISSPFGNIPIGAAADFVPLSEAEPWIRAMLGP